MAKVYIVIKQVVNMEIDDGPNSTETPLYCFIDDVKSAEEKYAEIASHDEYWGIYGYSCTRLIEMDPGVMGSKVLKDSY